MSRPGRYYCDLLAAPPAEPLVGDDERTVDVEEMCEWLSTVSPRTRVDAYPLWIMTREMLRRFLSRDLRIVSKEAAQLAERVRTLEDQVHQTFVAMAVQEADMAAIQAQAARASELQIEAEEGRQAAARLEAECQILREGAERTARTQQEERLAAVHAAVAAASKDFEARLVDTKVDLFLSLPGASHCSTTFSDFHPSSSPYACPGREQSDWT